MAAHLMTTRRHQLSDVANTLQKAIRRGDARVAGYFAIEMFMSSYAAYAWHRRLTISAEECAGRLTVDGAGKHSAKNGRNPGGVYSGCRERARRPRFGSYGERYDTRST
jgi:hypothetical protein